jgi:hypothetical protein
VEYIRIHIYTHRKPSKCDSWFEKAFNSCNKSLLIGMSSNPHFLSPKNGLVIYPLTSLPAFLSSVDGPGWASESPQL